VFTKCHCWITIRSQPLHSVPKIHFYHTIELRLGLPNGLFHRNFTQRVVYILNFHHICLFRNTGRLFSSSWSVLIMPLFTTQFFLVLLRLLRTILLWSQWPRGPRRGSAAAQLLGLRVRILPGAWMSVPFECCVLSGRGPCVGLITRREESCRAWCVWVWSWSLDNEEALAHWGLLRHGEKKIFFSAMLL
jgi:hypothetical protein